MPSFLEIFVRILLFNSSCEKTQKFSKKGQDFIKKFKQTKIYFYKELIIY